MLFSSLNVGNTIDVLTVDVSFISTVYPDVIESLSSVLDDDNFNNSFKWKKVIIIYEHVDGQNKRLVHRYVGGAWTARGTFSVNANAGTWKKNRIILIDHAQDMLVVDRSEIGVDEDVTCSSSSLRTWIARDSSRSWRGVAMSSDGKYQTACALNDYVYISQNYGRTWSPKDSTRGWQGVAMSADGKYQTGVTTYTEPANIYVSSDYGQNWVAKGEAKTYKKVDMSADGKYQIVVQFLGYTQLSSDYGQTWVNTGASRSWRGCAMSSDGQILAATVNNGYIYISTDFGNTWEVKATAQTWRDITMSNDGRYMIAAALNTDTYISQDYGQIWVAIGHGNGGTGVAITSSGRIQIMHYGQEIYISTDYGQIWTKLNAPILGWQSLAINLDGKYITAVPHGAQIYTS